MNFSGFHRSLGYIYLPNKKKGGKKDVKKATVNNPVESAIQSNLLQLQLANDRAH
jgi:hypothetical protein